MVKQGLALALVIGVVSGCGGQRGVGLGPIGLGGDPATLPASTRTEFEMGGVDPLPLYRFGTAGDPSPADAINAGGSDYRLPDRNLPVTVDGQTWHMRQIELNGENFVVVEGAAPTAALPGVIRTRTGCLVDPQPLRSEDAAVYTLDCS